MFRFKTIRSQIYWVFTLLGVVLMVNAIASYYIFRTNAHYSQKITGVISPSVMAIKDFENMVLESKTLATNWIYLQQNNTVKKQLSDIHLRRYPLLKSTIQSLVKKWESSEQQEHMTQALSDFEKILISEKGIMETLVAFEDYNQPQLKFESMSVLEDEVIPTSDKLMQRLSQIFLAKNNELIEYNRLFLDSEKLLKNVIIGLSALLILMAFLFSMYLSRLITRPMVTLKNVINQLGKGELEKPDLIIRENEIGEMIQSVHQLIEALKVTTEFANRIGNRDFSADFNPLSPKDDLGHALLRMRDNIKRSEAQLIRARDEAEQAAAAKSQFLSNMSHEIRTPMNAIIGLTELLIKEPNLTEKQWENLSIIKLSAENLLEIINDILDISKIDSGTLTIQNSHFNLREVVSQAVKIAGIKSKENHIQISCSVADEIPDRLQGDGVRLNQILLNLVHNSIKFTDRGFVKVSVTQVAQNQPEAEIHLMFEVLDTGMGIPSEKHEEIFESFKQLKEDHSRKWGGIGLGLSITRKLVTLMGGKIGLESAPGEGSRFWVALAFGLQDTEPTTQPIQPESAENPSTPADRAPVSPSDRPDMKAQAALNSDIRSLENIRVLIVEDNFINQVLMIEIMKKWNATFAVAANGAEALTELEKTDFDIVLMDLQMPVMDGYEATRHIRDLASAVRNHKIPILAVSADAYESTRVRALETGMDDYISKPFQHGNLYQKIKVLLASPLKD